MTARKRWGDRLAGECQRAGVRLRRTKSGWIAYASDGRTTVGWHITCSDHRAEANTRAALRRIGVRLDQ